MITGPPKENSPAELQKRMQELGVSVPQSSFEKDFCKLRIWGYSQGAITDELSLTQAAYKVLDRKFEGFVCAEILRRKDNIKADLIVRALQKVRELELTGDPEKGKGYFDYMKLLNEFITSDKDRGTPSPSGPLIVFTDSEGQEISIGEGKNKVTIEKKDKVIDAGDATTTDSIPASRIPETGSGE